MINGLSNNWGSLTEHERQLTLESAEREGRMAMEKEPLEWRIHLALANLYQTASARDSSYAQRARVLVEEAIALAPERIELQQLLVRQFLVEGDADGAMNTIDSFLEGHAEYMEPDSRVSQVFNTLRTEVQRAAGIADGG